MGGLATWGGFSSQFAIGTVVSLFVTGEISRKSVLVGAVPHKSLLPPDDSKPELDLFQRQVMESTGSTPTPTMSQLARAERLGTPFTDCNHCGVYIGRNSQVSSAILTALSAESWDAVTIDDLSGIASLDLSERSIKSLKRSDFEDLELNQVNLYGNEVVIQKSLFEHFLSSSSSFKLGFNKASVEDTVRIELDNGRSVLISQISQFFMSGTDSGGVDYIRTDAVQLPRSVGELSDEQVSFLLIFLRNNLDAGRDDYSWIDSILNHARNACADRVESSPEDCNQHGVFVARTPQVAEEILRLVPVNSWENVHPSMLSHIVSRLVLRNKEISSLKKHDFDGLNRLQLLDLSKNEISEIPSGVFNPLSSIKYLYVTDNKIEHLPDGIFGETTELTRLYLSKNKLSVLEDAIFKQLYNLETLSLAFNNLREFPEGSVRTLNRLKSLNIVGNRVTFSNEIFTYFRKNFKKLKIYYRADSVGDHVTVRLGETVFHLTHLAPFFYGGVKLDFHYFMLSRPRSSNSFFSEKKKQTCFKIKAELKESDPEFYQKYFQDCDRFNEATSVFSNSDENPSLSSSVTDMKMHLLDAAIVISVIPMVSFLMAFGFFYYVFEKKIKIA